MVQAQQTPEGTTAQQLTDALNANVVGATLQHSIADARDDAFVMLLEIEMKNGVRITQTMELDRARVQSLCVTLQQWERRAAAAAKKGDRT